MGNVPGQDCEPTEQRSDIDARLAHMRDQGGERFDAAGWHYLETLGRRTAAHKGAVRRLLEAKLAHALAVFAGRFAQARAAAAELLAATCEMHPNETAQLERLFAGGDFKGMRHLHTSLDARAQSAELAGLVSQFDPVLVGSTGRVPLPDIASRATSVSSPSLELKTVRESRSTWARLSVDRQISVAMKQAPQNAGPINSHMLVLRSLQLMQAISPDYLSRTVAYVDTLLALNPVEKDVPGKRKKAPATKAAKPTKTMRK